MGNRKGGKEEGGEEEAKNNQVSKRSEASLHQDDLPKTQQKNNYGPVMFRIYVRL